MVHRSRNSSHSALRSSAWLRIACKAKASSRRRAASGHARLSSSSPVSSRSENRPSLPRAHSSRQALSWSAKARTSESNCPESPSGSISSLRPHRCFHFVGSMGKGSVQINELSVLPYKKVALDAHADLLLGNVHSRLDRKHHARLQHCGIVCRIMYVDPNHVTQAMQPVFAQRLTVQILAMRIDVVISSRIQ